MSAAPPIGAASARPFISPPATRTVAVAIPKMVLSVFMFSLSRWKPQSNSEPASARKKSQNNDFFGATAGRECFASGAPARRIGHELETAETADDVALHRHLAGFRDLGLPSLILASMPNLIFGTQPPAPRGAFLFHWCSRLRPTRGFFLLFFCNCLGRARLRARTCGCAR